MEFVVAAALALAIKKVIDTVRMLAAGDFRGVALQLASWVGGFVGVWIVSQTPWADGIDVGTQNLAGLGIASLILIGLSVGSAASTAHDVVVAVSHHGIPVDVDPTPDRRDITRRPYRRD